MFKYFNPIWLIKNFLQPSLGPEILVPAAIGAVSSGAMGGNPIKGALLGGATGGILGGAGGNLLSGFKSALPTGLQGTSTAVAPSLGSGGYAAFAPTVAPTVAPNIVNPVISNASNMGNIGMANTFNTGAPSISNVTMATPEYVNPALITNPSQLPPPPPQTYTDGVADVADVIRPRFDEPIRVTEQATKTGGYETPFYEKTFNSILNYAQKNPLDIAGVGLVASGKIGPKPPPLQPRDVNITKGNAPQLGQLLQVRRPTRFS